MKILVLIICIAIPQIVGGLSALISGDQFREYMTLAQPPFAPPGEIFGIMWPILYLLMGIASYLVWRSGLSVKNALNAYGVQLFMNFCWSILFFRLELRLFAFFWLVALFIMVLITFRYFVRINRTAGYLLIPYMLWLIYAGYLNIGVWYLNR